MYIYTTPTFDDQAKQHGILTQVAELLVAIKSQGTTAVQALFEWNYPYLKRPARNLRLIGKILKVGSDQVLCLLAVFTRGGKEYEAFLRDPEEYGKHYLDSLINQSQLHETLQAQREEQQTFPKRQSLSEELHHLWLQCPDWIKNTTDSVICESEAWVTQFKQQEIRLQWRTYYEIVLSLVDGNPNIETAETPWSNLWFARSPHSHHGILFSWIETLERPNRPVLFLIATFSHDLAVDEITEVGHLTRLFNGDASRNILSHPLSVDDLSRYARRSYPDYLLGDPDVWLEIERESGINWALSVEEEQILHELSTPDYDKSTLPVFINGRAGSGKSTMLFYLFADYCYRYQKYYLENKSKSGSIPQPLFLTYNKRLLGKAKEGVEKLLNNHHKFLIETRTGRDKPSLDTCFQSFQEFLLNLLSPEESDLFDKDKYVSFHEFRQLCSRRYNRYSPELCWHIIRTFIKGYSLTGHQEGYMTPEDYLEVPRRERSISPEIFQAVYKQVWPWYYQLTTRDGYWDDQDLIRKVLQLDRDRFPQYTAIFCDEAQDFTKLELRLIMQLSLFSRCDLYPPVLSLPFAFAGDPFQTLNPTGFRWESVKATFFDQVIAALDPTRQLNLSMRFYELESNYRSSPTIVKVTNLIHLWRHVLFRIPELKPQEAWHQSLESSVPQKFIFGQGGFSSEALKRHVEKSPIFIVPCEAGGELEFIRNDEFLAPLFPDVTEENPPKNVLSAIQAKGLEFPLVIIYKFGDRFGKEFNRSIWDYVRDAGNHPIELEYFFNKLYVAVSRGVSDLIIIDTETGDRLLWQYATTLDPETQFNEAEKWLRQAENSQMWHRYIGGIRWGDDLGGLDRDNRESQAKEFEESGRSQKDSTSLRRAKQFYRELGYIERADLCEAWALKYDKKFRQAGILFLQRNHPDEAWDCFWDGMCWHALADWYQRFPNKKQIERPIVEFMTHASKTWALIEEFTLFLEECLASNLLLENRLVKPWKTAVQEYARHIRGIMREKILEREEWQRLGDVLEALDEAKYSGMLELAGDCFYRAENLKRAVRCWRESGNTQKREYNLAQAELLGYPEGLPFLEKIGGYQRIITEWENAGKPGNQQWLKYSDCIGRALERLNRNQDWVEYLIRTKRWVEAIAALEKCSDAIAVPLRFDLVRQLSRSSLTPDQAREFRSRYMGLMETVLSTGEWRQYLAVQEVGVALERMGELVPTLRFYEKFVNHLDPQLKLFARERWMATKIKQQDYAVVAEPARAEEIHREISRKAVEWGLRLAEISSEPPRLDHLKSLESALTLSERIREVLESNSNAPVYLAEQKNGNKSKGIQVSFLGSESGACNFQIGPIRVHRAKRDTGLKVILTNVYTAKALQIDLDGNKGCVKFSDILVEVSDGHELSFNSPSGDYNGVVIYRDEHPRIELQIKGIPNKILLS